MKNIHKKVEFHLKEGAFHHDLGIKAGEKIPLSTEEKALAHAKKTGNVTEERRAQFAINARHFNHKH